MKTPKKEINKKQLKSIVIMFLVLSVIYSVALINQGGVEPFIQEISKGANNLVKFVQNPSITGFAISLANEPPSFDPSPPDYNLTEDELFWVQLNATDDDNDTITFTDNSDAPEVNWPVFSMNGTGFISFTPTNDDVGNHSIGISIEDGINDPVTENVVFSVNNTNDRPEILNYTPTDLTPIRTENDSIGFSFEYNATDPDIPYGDYLTAKWIIDGVVDSTRINETSGSWNLTTGFCEPSNRNITLIVSDIENETDSITWDLSITNVNREPVWNAIINNITWEEDNELTNNISLDDYFYDPDYSECTEYGDTPSFSSTGSTNITITIGSAATHHSVSFSPDSNWFGTEEVFFTIDDSYATADSNNITLNVTNVQDSPVIESIPDQEAYAYVLFSHQVIASDPDNDTLTYYDNTTLFNISSATGIISFTPIEDNIGNYTINIIAGDGTDNASTLMNLSILNNTSPVIDSINNQTATEGTVFSLIVTGSDADEDSLIFSTNYSKMSNVWSNETATEFSFTPADEDNGNHTILVTLNDTRGATDSTTFVLQVVDVNNPPELDQIGNRTIKINHTFSLQVNASDPDSGDILSFSKYFSNR